MNRPAPQRAGPTSFLRRLAITLLMALLVFLGCVFYARAKIQSKLSRAIHYIAAEPKIACLHFMPILAYSNLASLGKVEWAQQQFATAMCRHALARLDGETPGEADIEFAARAAEALHRLRTNHQCDTTAYIRTVVRAVRDLTPHICENGTLGEWQALRAFWDFIDEADRTVYTPPRMSWRPFIHRLRQVDRDQLVLREIAKAGTDGLAESFHELALPPSPVREVLPCRELPRQLDWKNIHEALGRLEQARKRIHSYRGHIRNPRYEARLDLADARLQYNMAALKVTHLMDLGPYGSRFASQLMVAVTMEGRDRRMPPPDQLFERFTGLARTELADLRDRLDSPQPSFSEEHRIILELALCCELLLNRLLGETTGPLQERLQHIRSTTTSSRPCLERARRAARPMYLLP